MQLTLQQPQTRPISLDPRARVGHLSLTVRDLKKSLAFYRDVLGFKLHNQAQGTAHLGAGREDILVLTENPAARVQPFATGLYHFAVLVPSRFELARSLRRLGEAELQLGFGDHIVSEAIYLSDPDNNGIEIYRDRPRTDWFDKNGNFQMATLPVDVQSVLGELQNETAPWQGLDPDTILGHMHLKSANVKRDTPFYRDVIGLDEMANLGSASFLSAGGYHHHLGMNSWESANAAPPPADSVGLNYYTLLLPGKAEQERVTNRLLQAGAHLTDTAQGVLVRDPSQNAVVLVTQEA